MKLHFKYIILIVSFLSCSGIYGQSLITSKFYQTDTICDGTSGKIRLYMYNSGSDMRVSNLRLYFTYDPTSMEIKEVIPTGIFEDSNLTVNHPKPGACEIIDTLNIPNNFHYNDPDESRNIAFDIVLMGLKEDIAFINFNQDFCYFKTEDDITIASTYINSSAIYVKPGYIDFDMTQTNIGCSYEAKGTVIATVSDGVSPYTYKWDRGTVYGNLPHQTGELDGGELSLTITDGNGCLHDTSMTVEILKAPVIDWEYVPDPAIKEIPIEFRVTNFGEDGNMGTNWLWKIYTPEQDSIELGDNKSKTNFTHVFLTEGSYEVHLSANGSTTGCDTTIIKTVDVQAAQLDFKNLVTPNENKFKVVINSNSQLALSDVYVSHAMTIQDRNGRKVFDSKEFPIEGWDGGGCPNGTYYFVLKARSTIKDYVYKGAIIILGGNN